MPFTELELSQCPQIIIDPQTKKFSDQSIQDFTSYVLDNSDKIFNYWCDHREEQLHIEGIVFGDEAYSDYILAQMNIIISLYQDPLSIHPRPMAYLIATCKERIASNRLYMESEDLANELFLLIKVLLEVNTSEACCAASDLCKEIFQLPVENKMEVFRTINSLFFYNDRNVIRSATAFIISVAPQLSPEEYCTGFKEAVALLEHNNNVSTVEFLSYIERQIEMEISFFSLHEKYVQHSSAFKELLEQIRLVIDQKLMLDFSLSSATEPNLNSKKRHLESSSFSNNNKFFKDDPFQSNNSSPESKDDDSLKPG